MANLAENVDTHEYIAAAGGGKVVIALEHHASLDIHREATRCIANLLSSFRHQYVIIDDGISGLVKLSYSEDEECSYNAALSFRKLTPNIKSHSAIVYQNGYKALFHLLRSSNINTQKQAAAAVRDLTANNDYKTRCSEDGGVEALTTLLRQQDETLQSLSLAALRHLTVLDSIKQEVLAHRALKPILRAAMSLNEDLQREGALETIIA